ncbi:hypothetical protein B0H63DRAFT_484365 [Podospora didyma]|uniref:Uncharacterized protein n=1 Tax=Podospora didyma TaxID=330526 RepID=A0AAE0K910_9PEZI|nr:hypothetical protein B0H63DRAFT_484365 [Podospora didyma]
MTMGNFPSALASGFVLGDTNTPGEEEGHSQVAEMKYEPSLLDVIVVKTMMKKAMHLPPEMIDQIANQAEYWPHTSTEVSYGINPVSGVLAVRGGHGRQENQFLLRTPPIGFPKWPRDVQLPPNFTQLPPTPRPVETQFSLNYYQRLIGSPEPMLAHPCRKIVFTIRSKDQGWVNHHTPEEGPYSGSWTWFEAGLEQWSKEEDTTHDEDSDNTDTDTEKISDGSETGNTDNGKEPQLNSPQHQDTELEDEDEPHTLTVNNLGTVYPEVVRSPATDEFAFEHPLLPREDVKIQANLTAEKAMTEHRVVWSSNDDMEPGCVELEAIGRGKDTGTGRFVRCLQLGDIVTVWAKARFLAWTNNIESVKVDIYWAV